MKCPECKKELEYVHLYSQAFQKPTIDKEGRIIEYGCVEELLETMSIECPFCAADIGEEVQE